MTEIGSQVHCQIHGDAGQGARAVVPRLTPMVKAGLYDPAFERDACGVGLVANIDGHKNHAIVDQGLEVLINLGHRGACGCDPETGDGAGLLIQIPHDFLTLAAREAGFDLPAEGRYGVAMTFFPEDYADRDRCRAVFEQAVASEGLAFLGWRVVPIQSMAIGELARQMMPAIEQGFVSAPDGMSQDALEHKLYVTRKEVERLVHELGDAISDESQSAFYICSMSSQTLVYKGLIMAEQLLDFYADLSEPLMVSAFALVHSRFSTNTLGEWKLAHPYRYLAHNGEINTVRGNRNWMASRERSLISDHYGDDVDKLAPVCEEGQSDTASLDNVFELLAMGGRDLQHVAAMMIPEAWYGHESMDQELKDFYEFHGTMMEPWDGPALVAFTNGRQVGAVLDRNGLRPFRFTVTKDGLIVMASETGVLEIDPERIEYRDRIRPGRMFLLDLEQGRIVDNDELKDDLAQRQPYGEWLAENRLVLDDLPDVDALLVPAAQPSTLTQHQRVFQYTTEDLNIVMEPMARDAIEATGSMGNDAAIAVVSDRPQHMFTYFKQLFAQVSNPPLDAIREELVTQLSVPAGTRQNLFEETPLHARVLRIDHPIMTNADLAKLRSLDGDGFHSRTILTLFPVAEGIDGLRTALDRIRREANEAVEAGQSLIVLSDRGVDDAHTYIPSLLAVGAVHHHLIREFTRSKVDLILETGDPREVHHFATLFGYGAAGVNPYLAFESIAAMSEDSREVGRELPTAAEAEANYIKALQKGVTKVMSKMGISTLQGYQGAQIFEALGLSQELVDEFFAGTPTRIEGIGLAEIATDLLASHHETFTEHAVAGDLDLDLGGLYQWRATGEKHQYSPDTISLLQHASKLKNADIYAQFEAATDDESKRLATVRGLLDFNANESDAIPIDEVESAESIVTRFATGAISLGSISREAHETLAIAMNRLGARSNTGEGGEDNNRYTPDPNGDSRSSRMKQIASGRFGVTAEYLVNATDIQIKMAQGSKPGEGGQIPGHKISDYIAGIRGTTPGVELISPPPHHDIYSIEDLAQLIHDLKNINPEARVHVKLVSEIGVGIIAAGVAKGHADVVLISGDSGGTGASPLSSVKHGGLPWELGVAETQQVLVQNGLRGRIVVQTDGQLKTGRDIAIATLLGAEEWGIATAAVIVMGCIMLRKCHLNTCSVGIATQDTELREKFAGTPEAVVNYFMMLTESLREHMALLGFRTIDEMVGRVDKLAPRKAVEHWKAGGIDLSPLLYYPLVDDDIARYHREEQDHGLDEALDHELIAVAEPAIERMEPVERTFKIRNANRVVGTMMSGTIAKRYGGAGLPENTIRFTFQGSAGQSFAAWLTQGTTFRLEGDANDYLAKGLSGGRVIVVPPDDATYAPEDNVIIGNVALYGASGGEAYIRGIGGERFAVRNSSASAVIEGIGDHGCEYMTGGRVAVLGPTGRNFGAGMSGGVAYVWDENDTLEHRFNSTMADLEPVLANSLDEQHLRGMIECHLEYTDSDVARRILDDWPASRERFKKVMPKAYATVLRAALAAAVESASAELPHTQPKEVAGDG